MRQGLKMRQIRQRKSKERRKKERTTNEEKERRKRDGRGREERRGWAIETIGKDLALVDLQLEPDTLQPTTSTGLDLFRLRTSWMLSYRTTYSTITTSHSSQGIPLDIQRERSQPTNTPLPPSHAYGSS